MKETASPATTADAVNDQVMTPIGMNPPAKIAKAQIDRAKIVRARIVMMADDAHAAGDVDAEVMGSRDLANAPSDALPPPEGPLLLARYRKHPTNLNYAERHHLASHRATRRVAGDWV